MSSCSCVYRQEQMVGFFIEGCNVRTRNLVRSKFEEKKDMPLTKLAEFARDMHARTDGRMWTSDTKEADTHRRKRKEKNRNDQSPPTPLLRTDTSYQDVTSTPVSATGYDSPRTTPAWPSGDLRPSPHTPSPNPRPQRPNNNIPTIMSLQLFPTNRRTTPDNRRVNFPNPRKKTQRIYHQFLRTSLRLPCVL